MYNYTLYVQIIYTICVFCYIICTRWMLQLSFNLFLRLRPGYLYQILTFREPGLMYLSVQLLRKFCGELQRFAETVSFPCKMTTSIAETCVRARAAQKNVRILAGEIPLTYYLRTHQLLLYWFMVYLNILLQFANPSIRHVAT